MSALTAEVRLRLMTTSALASALRHVGWGWQYESWRTGAASLGHLYAWGVPKGDGDLAVLYIGVDESAAGDRISREDAMSSDQYVHGHARAIVRTKASAASAALVPCEIDLSWADDLRSQDDLEGLASRWRSLLARPRPIRLAEQFAVRSSLHLGDTGAPVNSQYKGAWNTSGADAETVNRMAELVAEHLVSARTCRACI